MREGGLTNPTQLRFNSAVIQDQQRPDFSPIAKVSGQASVEYKTSLACRLLDFCVFSPGL